MTAVPDLKWIASPAPVVAAPLPAVRRLHAERVPGGGLRVVAHMPVEPAEPHLAGHFPGRPIYPGVFVIETLCQALAAVLPGRPRLRTITSVRFRAALLGGDELTLTAEVTGDPGSTGGTGDAGVWTVRAEGRRRDGTVTSTVRAVFANGEA